jgi:hypothetical protein
MERISPVFFYSNYYWGPFYFSEKGIHDKHMVSIQHKGTALIGI